MRSSIVFESVDTYIQSFPAPVQEKLRQMRAVILENAPEAVESIAYGMPAYKLKGKPLVYFGGYAKHVGFYATPTGHAAFASALSVYKQGKGSVQFPLKDPLPIELIAEIVKFRVAEQKNRR